MRVNFVGKFYDNHSLSIVNRNLAIQLKELIDLTIQPLDAPQFENNLPSCDIEILKSLETDTSDANLELRHSYPPSWMWPALDTTKVVYIQPWEFMAIPSEWQYKFDTFADAVITPSTWTANIFKLSGIDPKKVFTIPNGYNDSVFNKPGLKPTNKIRVLYVGCHQYRKGVDLLLKVWGAITNSTLQIELVIKDTPQVYGESNLLDDIVKLQYNTNCATIIYDNSSKSELEMAELYKSSHIIVHPYRGEGFGMHIQEAMACGCIPLVTAGGPTDEFVEDFKINSTKSVVNMFDIFALKVGDSMSLMGQHKWVLSPDINDLALKLKYLLEHKDLTSLTPNTSRLNTWSNIAKMYKEVLYQVDSASTVRRVR